MFRLSEHDSRSRRKGLFYLYGTIKTKSLQGQVPTEVWSNSSIPWDKEADQSIIFTPVSLKFQPVSDELLKGDRSGDDTGRLPAAVRVKNRF